MSNQTICFNCKGSGFFLTEQPCLHGSIQGHAPEFHSTTVCPKCNGTCRITITTPCHHCHGTGKMAY